jgi:phage baseplate assembly protein W
VSTAFRALSFPFRLNSSGTFAECANYDEIVRGQVVDAVMTNQGERVMRPRYGCDVQSALFDPADELERMDAGSVVKARLSSFVSRSFIRSSVFVEGDPGVSYLNITYRATPYSTDASLTIPVSSEFLNRAAQEASNK